MTPQDPTAQDRLIGAGTKLCDCCRNLPSQCTCQPVSYQPTAETPTPETDAIIREGCSISPVSGIPKLIAKARTLERQRDAARAELERVKGKCPHCNGVPERPEIPECRGCLRCDFTGTLEGYEFMRRMDREAHEAGDAIDAAEEIAQLRADLAAAREERDAAQLLNSFLEDEWHKDKALPEDEKINAAHPVETDNHKRYAEAMRLVGARSSKYGLVNLVNWLLAEKETATARAVEAERALEAMHSHLGEMLDEIRITKRDTYPHDLLCVECECRVSKLEPHKPACKIGLAIAAWDAIDAARVAALPGDGEGK